MMKDGELELMTMGYKLKSRKATASASTISSTKPKAVTTTAASTTSSTKVKAIEIEVTKPTKATKLGITLQPVNGRKSIVVGTIAKNSLFAGTALRQGMELVSINKSMYSTFDEGVALLKASEGRISILAAIETTTSVPT